MYSVEKYLGMLKLAKRSPGTIKTYHNQFLSYARFHKIPLEEVHNHLSVDELNDYIGSLDGISENGRKGKLNTLHRFFVLNGVKFDEMQTKVMKSGQPEDPDDKPLELETLQRMMDLGTIHAKAIIAVLISTGMRSGECSKILLSDVKGDTIHIRNEIAKGRRGGKVYLSQEAQEYLSLWLKDRDAHIRAADIKTKQLFKDRGLPSRPKDDKRLFACSYSSIYWIFNRLYMKVDGEKGKYGNKISPSSCRKYFRTHAVRTMDLDLVEKIMRHTGYLTSSYVRISDEEARSAFHAGESALYITRSDQRKTTSEIDILKKKLSESQDTERQVMVLVQKYIREMERKG